MRFDEPSWWYRPDATLVARLLAPVASVWSYASERRFRTSRPYRSPLPVICIGNFTAGGTGKTPLAILVASLLRCNGHAPVFLTRGYGGSLPGPHLVDPARDDASMVGDEPLLLTRAAPVILSRDRAAGAKAAAILVPKADVLIMDDGLQNPSLVKDLSIAVVDAKRGIGNAQVIPAGPLRAALDRQLARTDVIVVNATPSATVGSQASEPPFRRNFHGPVLTATTRPAEGTERLVGSSFVAYAGIGAPHRFFQTLTACGAVVMETKAFPDHHPFTETEAQDLLTLAATRRAQLITTEKDWVRLSSTTPALARLREQSITLAITTTFEPEDLRRLEAFLLGALNRRTQPAYTKPL